MSQCMNRTAVMNALADVPGLWDADPVSLLDLANVFDVVTLTDDWLFREGDEAERIFILAEGELEVVKRGRDGKNHGVATLTPGVLFGHVPLVTNLSRTAGVRAPETATVLALDIDQARSIMDRHDLPHGGPLRRALIVALARQLTTATDTTLQLAARVGQTRPDDDQDLPLSLTDALEIARSWT